jgi:quercetin dioxygenase-like cupin family protein
MNRSAPFLSLALLSLIAAAPSHLKAQPVSAIYSPPTNSTPLGSTFVDWDSLKFKATPVGLYCAVFDNPTPTLEKFELHITTLFPGMSPHSPHHHPWEEIFVIKEGQLEVSINGKKQTAGPGSMAFIGSHDVHHVTNTGDKPATYYVMTFCTAAVHTVRDQPAAEWAPAGTLPSQVVDCDSIAPPAGGGHKTIFDSPTLTLLEFESHISTLKPGASTKPGNRDPGDELFIVKSGVLEVTLNGISSRMSAGSLYYVAPNDARTMKNIGTQPCSYQVIKVVSEKSPSFPGPG